MLKFEVVELIKEGEGIIITLSALLLKYKQTRPQQSLNAY